MLNNVNQLKEDTFSYYYLPMNLSHPWLLTFSNEKQPASWVSRPETFRLTECRPSFTPNSVGNLLQVVYLSHDDPELNRYHVILNF